MDQIKITKKNEAFLFIETDASVEMELTEHFCFFVPGYKFMPAYRNKFWDGKIRLFDTRKKTLYVGLYKYLKEFAAQRGYEVLTSDSTQYGSVEPERLPLDFGRAPILTANQMPIEPRDYQFKALEHALKEERSLLLSPTASGKSLIIYLAARWYIEQDPSMKILIVVPTISLVEQMYSDFDDYSSTDEWFNVDEWAMKIHGGTVKGERMGRIVISTWQSIYKRPASFFQNFGMVIGDEAHQFKAKSMTAIMEKCTEAKYRIGTTGTLDGAQTHQLVLEGLFGPVHKVTTTKELMDTDQLAKLEIQMLLLKYKEEHCKEISKLKYQEEIDFIVRYTPRNNFIANLALDQQGNTLVLFNYVEKHGKPLHNILRDKIKGDRKLFYVSGETDVDTRENVRSITETQNNAIIVASLGTFSTGINIRNLHNIIFASPSKSQIRVLQSIGRGLRKSTRNTKVYDIADDLHWKTNKNYTLNHAAERIKIYSKEKFDYELFEINI
jgi:superfamily II DNA or RNA helicase